MDFVTIAFAQEGDIAPRRHALTIFEVLKTIFGHLGEHDLARVSRVCRWWSSTALNLLWRSIRNLTVLIKTGYPMRYVSRIGAWEFADHPTDRMWDVVKGYALLVREVHLPAREFAPSVISHISSRVKSDHDSPYLLPKLCKVNSFQLRSGTAALAIIRMMPPDTLRAISLDCPSVSSPGQLARIFRTLSNTPFRRLTSIIISAESFANQAVLASLCSVIQVQSDLRRLEVLDAKLTAEDLERFGIQNQLTALKIYHRGASLQSAERMFTVIGACFPGLETLKIRLDHKLKDHVGASTMAGLRLCRKLSCLEVFCSRTEVLSHQMMWDMGGWWPLMETLCFGGGSDFPDTPGTPLGVLRDAPPAWLSDLRSLRVPFDLGRDGLSDLETGPDRFRRLRSITTPSTHLSDDNLPKIAEFLAAMTTPHFIVRENRPSGRHREDRLAKLNKRISAIHRRQGSSMPQTE